MTSHKISKYAFTMIVGNDISAFQGNLNYDIYAHNSNFIIFKDDEGINFQDPQFLRNQSEARRVGLSLGYYHFARPDLGNSARAEAENFVFSIGRLEEGEILCLDYEVGFDQPVQWCLDFLNRCVELTNVHPLIYLNKSEVHGYDWTPVAEAGFGLWLACYDNNLITGAWKLVAMQQWTNAQQVPGIPVNADGDYFFGTVEQFKLYGFHQLPTPSHSVSASVSPSASISPSSSTSSSVSSSSSISSSASPSASPSPSEPVPDDIRLAVLAAVIHDQWNWFGSKGWYRQLARLRKILNG